MKRLMALLVMLMLLLPALACAQGLYAGLEQALGQVDLAPRETAAREDNLLSRIHISDGRRCRSPGGADRDRLSHA